MFLRKMEKLIYAVNAILLLLMARYEYNSDNDKSIIISSLAFLALLITNLLMGFVGQMSNKKMYKHFYFSALWLLISVLVLLSMW